MNWIPFDGTSHKLPKEYQPVLVKLEGGGHESGGVAVGYLRYAAGDRSSPYFVCVGIAFRWKATHWADCLPEDLFESVPGWAWPRREPKGEGIGT